MIASAGARNNHAARDQGIHQQPVTEAVGIESLPVLAQRRKLGQPERKSGIVGDAAEVAEVVGDAFALEQQRAQPGRPLRNHATEGAFAGHAVGPGEGDRGVARDAGRQRMSARQPDLLEPFLDTAVRVAEALLEAQHLFAHHRETEVPGLDGTGVDRADGDLVHAIAFDAHVRIRLPGAGRDFAHVRVAAQRETAYRPRAVLQPRACVDRAGCDMAEEIVDRALHARRAREHPRQIGITRVDRIERQLEPGQAVDERVGRMHDESAARFAAVAAPQRDEASAALADRLRRGTPLPGIHDRMPYRGDARQDRRFDADRAQGHGAPPSRPAACRYHWSR